MKAFGMAILITMVVGLIILFAWISADAETQIKQHGYVYVTDIITVRSDNCVIKDAEGNFYVISYADVHKGNFDNKRSLTDDEWRIITTRRSDTTYVPYIYVPVTD